MSYPPPSGGWQDPSAPGPQSAPPADPTLPLESRIIRTANAFDDMVGGSADSGPRLAALERLRLAMAYDYDPRVVETLSRVVERTTAVGV